MSPELAERIKAHKAELFTILPESDGGSSETEFTARERELMRDAHVDLWNMVTTVKRHFLRAEVVTVRTPRQRLATLICDARREGNRSYAVDLRERWHERAAIMEFDGSLPRAQAESAALVGLLKTETRACMAPYSAL